MTLSNLPPDLFLALLEIWSNAPPLRIEVSSSLAVALFAALWLWRRPR
jgi:hypothetical protein